MTDTTTTLTAPVIPTTTLAFTAPAWGIKQALQTVTPAIAATGALPVLSCIRMEGTDDGRLRLTGSDLELTMSVDVIGARDVVPGVALIKPKLLLGMVHHASKTKPGGDLSVSMPALDEIEMTLGKRRQVVKSLPVEEYPRLVVMSDLVGLVSIDTDRFADVLGAVSTEDARPILCTMFVGDGEIAATDSYRLYTVSGPTFDEMALEGDGRKPILIPGRAVKEVVKTGGAPALSWMEREASFDWNNEARTSIVVRLVDGEFPNYKGLIPKSMPNLVTFDRGQVLDALKAIKKFPTELNTPVRLHLGETAGEARVSVIVQDVGQDEHTVDAPVCETGGDMWTVAYNPTYLQDAVEGLEGDTFTLEFVDAQKPAIIREARSTGGERRRLLMPVRIA